MSPIIRLLGPGDASVLENVAPDVFDDPIDRERADEFLADPRHYLVVAVADGQVVGFVSAVHYVHPDKSRPQLWINEIAVAPPYQRQGIGRRLMQRLLDRGRELGCREAWLGTEPSNTAARRCYAAAGGVEAPYDNVNFVFDLGQAE
jgi:aminoglycoside 6'-N-acetyltransferase I